MAGGWGWRIHPIYKVRKFHYGLDFSAPEGTEIFATGDGVVVKVKRLYNGYGRHVIIRARHTNLLAVQARRSPLLTPLPRAKHSI